MQFFPITKKIFTTDPSKYAFTDYLHREDATLVQLLLKRCTLRLNLVFAFSYTKVREPSLPNYFTQLVGGEIFNEYFPPNYQRYVKYK